MSYYSEKNVFNRKVEISGLGRMNLWWEKNFGCQESTGETFPVGGMSNFWPVGNGLPPSSQLRKPCCPPPPKKSVENAKPPIWLSTPPGVGGNSRSPKAQ